MDITIPEHISNNITRFSGRTWLLPKILDWYDQGTDRLLLVVGKPGSGKSMISAWLAGFGPPPPDPGDQARLVRLRAEVKGVHFCQVDSLNNSPKEMAEQLARQLTTQVEGFGEALVGLLGKRVVIQATANVGTVAAGGRVTNVRIEKIDLGKLFDEPSVDTALLAPLSRALAGGNHPPILIIVDALDEANRYRSDYKIIQAVLKLVKLQVPVRVLVTLRDEEDVLSNFRGLPTIDLIQDAPNGGQGDIDAFVDQRLKGSTISPSLTEAVKKNTQGNFLFASLVVEDLLARQAKGEMLTLDDIPDELGQHYHDFLQRLGERRHWEKEYRPLLGLAAVAQDQGLGRAPLARMVRRTPEQVLDTLRILKQYLDGALDNGPFRIFHKSFSDYLLAEQSNQDFKVDPSSAHANIVYFYWPKKETQPPEKNWDGYARRNMPTHLAGAGQSLDDQERHRMVQRLVQLVSDPVLQPGWQMENADLSQVKGNLLAAIQTACGDATPEALPFVLRAVTAMQAFHEVVKKPQQVFNLAEAGNIDGALSNLHLFDLEPRWQKAAQLTVAWLALATYPQEARELLNQVSAEPPFPAPLDVLHSRVEAALGGPNPNLLPLPGPPTEEVLKEMLYRTSGQKVDQGLIDSYTTELNIQFNEQIISEFSSGTTAATDSASIYQASQDAPVLVSFALYNPKLGDEYLKLYLRVQGANLYIVYRNIALWLLLEAVLRHPDPKWTRETVRQVLQIALLPDSTPFDESLPLAVLGLKAAAGEASATVVSSATVVAGAAQELETRRVDALQKVDGLSEERKQSDITGEHKRRLCALALAYLPAKGGRPVVEALLQRALNMPRGFAGFMTRTWLNLAETLAICHWTRPEDISWALNEAMVSAQKIQDPVFCVISTARIRGMQTWWPLPTGKDLVTTVQRFAHSPAAAEFAPLHLVAFDYPERKKDGSNRMDLPASLANANTLAQLSQELGLPLDGLLALNKEQGWTKDTPLPTNIPVHLPDPEFAPLMAARLSAEVLVADLSPLEKQTLIQLLVPPAFVDATVTDTLLARLVIAAEPDDVQALELPERQKAVEAGQPAAPAANGYYYG